MSEKMQSFVGTERRLPHKRPAEARREDFSEIYSDFDPESANKQASRCAQCGVPYCQMGCPLHNNIPDWLMLAAKGRLKQAYELSAATSHMPEICGRICPQDRLCEQGCVIEQAEFGSVTIGATERFITETAWEKGWVQPLEPHIERSKTVGIVGSGPAGLAAAEDLRTLGYGVTIYEQQDRPGGLLVYGIPNFKLEKSVVERRIRRLREGGIEFALGVRVGRDLSFEAVRERHDAILLATGVYRSRQLTLPGSELPGVVGALDYLVAENRRGFGDTLDPTLDQRLSAKDRRVVVIGGGDTAMDCVRTALRQGAKAVTCVYRRDRANMPGSAREVENAVEEGVEFCWLAQPVSFSGEGRVQSMRAQRMRLTQMDAAGRQTARPRPDQYFDLDADLAIKALGFMAEPLPDILGSPDLRANPDGSLQVDQDLTTGIPGVYAAGDIMRGASLVVWALADGRRAAQSIHRQLQDEALAAGGPR